MDAQKEKELTERMELLESIIDAQTSIVEKCYDLMTQMLDTQARLIKAVGYKRTRTKKGVG